MLSHLHRIEPIQLNQNTFTIFFSISLTLHSFGHSTQTRCSVKINLTFTPSSYFCLHSHSQNILFMKIPNKITKQHWSRINLTQTDSKNYTSVDCNEPHIHKWLAASVNYATIYNVPQMYVQLTGCLCHQHLPKVLIMCQLQEWYRSTQGGADAPTCPSLVHI